MAEPQLPPLVSVIVPVYNASATLAPLLRTLQAQRYPAPCCEFILVDDASTDGTPALLQRLLPTGPQRWRLLHSARNRGSYHARNLGLAEARGSIIAFTDADCQPDADWLARGVAALQAQGGGLLAGAVHIRPDDSQSAVQCYDAAFGIQQAYFARKLQFGATANLLVERPVADRIGGFDATLRSGGDRKFCRDGVALGETFGYAPASVVMHPPRRAWRELAHKQIRISTGQVRIFPRWSRLYVFPLGGRDTESFDRQAFAAGSRLFKARFRAVYYSLELLHLMVYGWGCLRHR